jgi:PD-(D/E)XK nuclease superfamily
VGSTGEPVLLCGHLDRVAELAGDHYVIDVKTTESELSDYYFARFTPDNQMSMYSLAGRVAFSFETKGVIVDGLQVGVGFTRFSRRIVPRTRASQEEWLAGTHHWLQQMDATAQVADDMQKQGRAGIEAYAMNDKACGLYASRDNPGGCPFREVCGKDPGSREMWLRQGFVKRTWDPLVPRGQATPAISQS